MPLKKAITGSAGAVTQASWEEVYRLLRNSTVLTSVPISKVKTGTGRQYQPQLLGKCPYCQQQGSPHQ